MDYKSRVLDENAMFSLTSSSGIYSSNVHEMFRRANQHSSLCILPMDGVFITNIFSNVRLVKL